jgi:hypothetical protein
VAGNARRAAQGRHERQGDGTLSSHRSLLLWPVQHCAKLRRSTTNSKSSHAPSASAHCWTARHSLYHLMSSM